MPKKPPSWYDRSLDPDWEPENKGISKKAQREIDNLFKEESPKRTPKKPPVKKPGPGSTTSILMNFISMPAAKRASEKKGIKPKRKLRVYGQGRKA